MTDPRSERDRLNGAVRFLVEGDGAPPVCKGLRHGCEGLCAASLVINKIEAEEMNRYTGDTCVDPRPAGRIQQSESLPQRRRHSHHAAVSAVSHRFSFVLSVS